MLITTSGTIAGPTLKGDYITDAELVRETASQATPHHFGHVTVASRGTILAAQCMETAIECITRGATLVAHKHVTAIYLPQPTTQGITITPDFIQACADVRLDQLLVPTNQTTLSDIDAITKLCKKHKLSLVAVTV